MKKYYLSTSKERITGIIFSLIMIVVLVLMLVALRSNVTILLLTGICVVLVCSILVIYILNVTKAACVPDLENHVLRIQGVRERVVDLDKVAQLETIPVKSGQVESRSLAFTDEEGKVVAIVPTYFTSNRGVQSEPMAKELAQVCNLRFKANVPLWEYDEEARKIHDQEVAKQAKADAKARREGRQKARVAKIRKKMDENRKDK